MRIPIVFALVPFFLLVAMPSEAADDGAEKFVSKAATLHLFQIRSSELAIGKGANDETRSLAREILGAHKDARRDLAVAAKTEAVVMPDRLDKEYAEKLVALEQAPERDFDAAFMSTQVSTYAETSRLYQDFIKTGKAGKIRVFAEETYPELHMLETRVNAQSSPGAITDGED